MSVEDLDLDLTKLTEGAQRVITRAEDEARRRGQDLLTSEHLFLAFAQTEWLLYSRVMRDLSVNPDELVAEVASALETVPSVPGRTLKATELTQELVRRAIQQAVSLGREQAESYDLFAAILEERQSQLAGTLSGGQQRMLSLGMAIMAKPKLMLLDEPSLGLSPAIVQSIFQQIRQFAQEDGMSVLLVEQNVRAALRIADRAYFMRTGDIILEESSETALARGSWWDLF